MTICHTIPQSCPGLPPTNGTMETPFSPITDQRDRFIGPGYGSLWPSPQPFQSATPSYQTLTFQQQYQRFSTEELRLQDYINSGKTRPAATTTNLAAFGLNASAKDFPSPNPDSSVGPPITRLPEELLCNIVERLDLSAFKSFRLSSLALTRASAYSFSRLYFREARIQFCETWLKSLASVSHNQDFCQSLQKLTLEGQFINPEHDRHIGEHGCCMNEDSLDCPVHVHEQLIDGCSKPHVALLVEIFNNLKNLKLVHLQASPVVFENYDADTGYRAWYPMSSWPFRSVIAAFAESSAKPPELSLLELQPVDWRKEVMAVKKARKDTGSGKVFRLHRVYPPPTDALVPSWDFRGLSSLKSLDLRLDKPPVFRRAMAHPSMFRYMRAFLTAAAPSLETLSIWTGNNERQDLVDGLLGGNMHIPNLKTLTLQHCLLKYPTLKGILLTNKASIQNIELKLLKLLISEEEVEEIEILAKEHGIQLGLLQCDIECLIHGVMYSPWKEVRLGVLEMW